MSKKKNKTSFIPNETRVEFGLDSKVEQVASEFIERLRKSSKQISMELMQAFSTDIIEAPLPFFDLAHFVINNTWHSRCVELKSVVAISPGIDIVSKSKEGQQAEEIRERLDEISSKKSTSHSSFSGLLTALSIDLESLGNAYFEVMRDALGRPCELYHVPSLTVRKRQKYGYWQMAYVGRGIGETAFTTSDVPQATKESYAMFGGGLFQKIFFKEYGDTRNFNTRGEIVNYELPEEERANEIIHIRRYHPLSPFYGIPTWISCFTSIVGDEAAEKWNLSFFENNRVPRWMFVLSGANLSDKAKEEIKLHFTEMLRARPHTPMVISNPSPTMKVETHKLETDSNEASFLEYRRMSRDEIIASHGVPPRMVGIITPGALGGNGDAQKQREDFKAFTIKPLQERIIEPFNSLILPDLGYDNYEICLQDFAVMDAEEYDTVARSVRRLVTMGLLTINEGRKRIGLKAIPEDWANKYMMFIGDQVIPMSNESFESFVRDQAKERKLTSSLSASKKRMMSVGNEGSSGESHQFLGDIDEESESEKD